MKNIIRATEVTGWSEALDAIGGNLGHHAVIFTDLDGVRASDSNISPRDGDEGSSRYRASRRSSRGMGQ